MGFLNGGDGVDIGGPIATPVGGGIFAPGGLVSEIARYVPGAAPIIEGVRTFFGGGIGTTPTGTTEFLPGGGTSTTWGDTPTFGGMDGRGGGGGWRAGTAASVRSVIPRFLEGAAVAATIYEAYRLLRSRGMGHSAAKRAAHRMHGLFTKRRRMKATNARALRRAMRRIKGARKMFGKVRGLMGHRGGGWRGYGRGGSRPRRHRRGDLYDNVENEQDTIDDLLDDGYSPEEIEDFFGGID